jgi:hypothetical protein
MYFVHYTVALRMSSSLNRKNILCKGMANTVVYKDNFVSSLNPFVLPMRNFIQEIGTTTVLLKWAAMVEDWALQLNS